MKTNRKPKRRGRGRRAGDELARTLSVASQMALLCPPGMDIWMQRELGGLEPPRHPAAPRR